MKTRKFAVTIQVITTWIVTVDAKSEDEARRVVEDENSNVWDTAIERDEYTEVKSVKESD